MCRLVAAEVRSKDALSLLLRVFAHSTLGASASARHEASSLLCCSVVHALRLKKVEG